MSGRLVAAEVFWKACSTYTDSGSRAIYTTRKVRRSLQMRNSSTPRPIEGIGFIVIILVWIYPGKRTVGETRAARCAEPRQGKSR